MKDKCRSCGADVVWTETTSGKRMPVDLEPTTEGNIILGLRHERPPVALVQTKQALELLKGELLYTSHFVTCPQSKKWRKHDE